MERFPDDDEDRRERPPGQFMDETHETDTRRFVEEALQLARRRAAGPPPFDENGD